MGRTGKHLLLLTGVLTAACSDSNRLSSYETLTRHAHRDAWAAQKSNAEGLAAIEAGDLESAEKAFREALEADLWYGPAHNNLGLVLLQRGELYEAALECSWAAKLMPHSACPRNSLGLIYERAGRIDQAIGHYAESLKLSPENIEVMGHLARAYVKSDRRDVTVCDLLKELAYRGSEGWDLWARAQLVRLGK